VCAPRWALQVLERLPVGVVVAESPSSRVLYANAHVRRIWGMETGNKADRTDFGRYIGYHPDGRRYEQSEWPVERVATQGEIVRGEIIDIERRDGERRTIEVWTSPLLDADGQQIAGMATVQDVTARVRAENERAMLEEALTIATSITPMQITVCDRDLRYTWYSRRQPGWPKTPVLGKRPDEVAPPEVASPLIEAKEQVLASGQGQHRVLTVPGPDGERVFEYHFEPMHDITGVVTGVVSAAYEVTRLERLRRQLQESEANFRAVLRHAPMLLGRVGPDLRYRWVYDPQTPDDPAARIGQLVGTVRPSPDADVLREQIRLCMESGQSAHFNYRTTTPDGHPGRFEVQLDPVFNAEGAIESVSLVAIDRTEHDRLTAELAASEARFQTFMEHLPARAWIKDAEGRYLFTNRALR
jgi:PAS domain S-box-containing protein